MNREEELFPWQSTYHPHEARAPFDEEDLLSLAESLRSFNGFYTKHGKWVLMNPNRQLMIVGAGAVLLLVALTWLVCGISDVAEPRVPRSYSGGPRRASRMLPYSSPF